MSYFLGFRINSVPSAVSLASILYVIQFFASSQEVIIADFMVTMVTLYFGGLRVE